LSHIDEPLTGGGRTSVFRRGMVVHRETGPWAPAVHALLRHLEAVGFEYSPRVVGNGFDEEGRETLTFIPGASLHPGPWPSEAMFALGSLLARLHAATETFVPPADARWRPWFGRELGSGRRVIGHCDLGDWNIIADAGQPVALIDWEQAGPVDPLVELAQLCWLNAHLFDDDLVERLQIPELRTRASNLAAILDGYGLPRSRRAELVETMIQLSFHDAANEAREAAITPESTGPTEALWAMAWRSRSAVWMDRNRSALTGR
jgi:hypothetical protein